MDDLRVEQIRILFEIGSMTLFIDSSINLPT